ncbi:MAG: hypothetical protein BWY98_01037 [Tenericutes bacterium ADurb.BinA155]|nr:MAG: hypothetical protein BWY98_01037 [Tenericutes bacterium ADurb.BinA155]
MTNRLSKTMKKKLEASLENLTARQAGRLFLIYANETFEDESLQIPVSEYPPVVELYNAWQRRVDSAMSKKSEDGTQTIAAYNGFLSLTNLIKKANQIADSDLWRLYTLAISKGALIDQLMVRDSHSELARITVSQFTEDAPRPLSWEDYNKAAEWYEGYSPEDLEELANELTGEYTRRQGYEILEVPDEFLKKISTPEVEYSGEDEEVRRKWVESEGEDSILKKHFAGDEARLEAWKQHGGSPEFNGREWDTMADEILDDLINKVKSGELEGGLCVGFVNHWEFTPVKGWALEDPDYTANIFVPAWNALRSIWIGWLYDKGIYRGDEKRVEADWPDILESFYDIDGNLDADRITDKAKEFYLECRKKTWGTDLIDSDKVDFAELGRFLCTDASPLMGYYAPDLGTVKVREFEKVEGKDPFLGPTQTAGDSWYYATLRGLRKIAEELGTDQERVGRNFVREFYYPTDNPRNKRDTISNLIRRMNQLRVSHRPFTYKEKGKREISSFLGLDFYTPLEVAIREFGGVFDDVETFKMTYDLISQELFDGIPVLSPVLRDRLEGVEEALKVTEKVLNDWLDLLSEDIWNVDTSSLRLVKTGPNEKSARIWAGAMIYAVDDEKDRQKFPTWLDGGETFEDVAKRISGFNYADLKKVLMKGRG